MHANECWACRDSRAVCNRVRPCCSRCAKSDRLCQYGLRLSWPKATNTKRSLTHSHYIHVTRKAKCFSQTSFVNTTSWDIQLHDYLRMTQGLDSYRGFVLQRIDPPVRLSWLPTSLGYRERELLDHFICTASSTLVSFEPSNNELLGLLLRLALLDSSPSSMAVLQSALAVSSFHRYGLQADVFRFKARALRILITSCDHCIESPTVVQHIAASMILCHLEVCLSLGLCLLPNKHSTALKMLGMPNALSLWYCHLNEARALIDNEGIDRPYLRGEFSRLLDWVEYHMVMSRFSLRHWNKSVEPVKEIANLAPAEPGTCYLQKVKLVSYGSHEILRYFGIMFETIRKPTDSLYYSEEYENSLRCLENRISYIIPLAPELGSETMYGLSAAWVATIELFKLSALIYFKRASRNFSGTSTQISVMVKRAYVLLDNLETFNLAFPLLIIGCESRTDEERIKIVEHITRAMKTSSLRSLHELLNILQQIWVQDDLAVDYELDYLNKLDAVISSYKIIPNFV